jgi:hypothetical protein
LLLVACGLASCAAPIVPQRTKPGGSARWAESIARDRALTWAKDAPLCRILGTGIGNEGWLPDRGGAWLLHYWSEAKPLVLQVTVDSDGTTQTRELEDAAGRGRTLPAAWSDSPKVWSVTHRYLVQEPLNTFDAEFAFGAEPERYPDRPVWRIRFWQPGNTYETHVVGADGVWLTSY